MANPSPHHTLHPPPPPPPLHLLLTTTANATTTFRELETMLEALRNHGYTLFTNAITTSDIQYQLFSTTTSPFTLFAPKDSPLRQLCMDSDAPAYVSTLRYHVIPDHRHTFTDLQNLSSPFLNTLLPHYSALIGKIQDTDVLSGNTTVVHGIDGILVIGLNMYRDLDGNDKERESFPRAESPSSLSSDQFGWNNDGNIRVAPAPEILQDEGERLKNVRKKKRARRHRRRGRGHHERSRSRRHRVFHGHHPDDVWMGIHG
ncbi:UNVERIFIED_CONTAM: hypothetical protein Sradi_0832300 [Sesamum radiatum]|uniref:FAS1 domain-containing protein n=1 Tax=Sesamum radiatum TaxID=300843 RepID=A0AAW2VS94_SESRA